MGLAKSFVGKVSIFRSREGLIIVQTIAARLGGQIRNGVN
jgi:hypothetical protein